MHLIGEQPAPKHIGLILPGVETPKAEPVNLILPESAKPDPKVVNVAGEEVSSMSWAKFAALRPTTCKPRITSAEALLVACKDTPAIEVSDNEVDDLSLVVRSAEIEEITQATLEMIGECGELGELVAQNGVGVFYGDARQALIDECGDIMFTASWALDAWCLNPEPGDEPSTLKSVQERSAIDKNVLRDFDDTEIIRVQDDDAPAKIAQVIATSPLEEVADWPKFLRVAMGLAAQQVATVTINAALTANSLKKLKYQRREQDIGQQLERIGSVLAAVNILLIMANSSMDEAMRVNRAKLDRRFPGGYKPGQGGGIRDKD